MLFILLALAVFLAAAALDYATARYVRAVQKRERHKAARWSVVMGALGLVGFLSVIEVSIWLVAPELMGLYAGTYFALGQDGKPSN